jgi:hypothetical protein
VEDQAGSYDFDVEMSEEENSAVQRPERAEDGRFLPGNSVGVGTRIGDPGGPDPGYRRGKVNLTARIQNALLKETGELQDGIKQLVADKVAQKVSELLQEGDRALLKEFLDRDEGPVEKKTKMEVSAQDVDIVIAHPGMEKAPSLPEKKSDDSP